MHRNTALGAGGGVGREEKGFPEPVVCDSPAIPAAAIARHPYRSPFRPPMLQLTRWATESTSSRTPLASSWHKRGSRRSLSPQTRCGRPRHLADES
eukprot:scaffold5109_cov112-Isochrysis_galbana.AAC.3